MFQEILFKEGLELAARQLIWLPFQSHLRAEIQLLLRGITIWLPEQPLDKVKIRRLDHVELADSRMRRNHSCHFKPVNIFNPHSENAVISASSLYCRACLSHPAPASAIFCGFPSDLGGHSHCRVLFALPLVVLGVQDVERTAEEGRTGLVKGPWALQRNPIVSLPFRALTLPEG